MATVNSPCGSVELAKRPLPPPPPRSRSCGCAVVNAVSVLRQTPANNSSSSSVSPVSANSSSAVTAAARSPLSVLFDHDKHRDFSKTASGSPASPSASGTGPCLCPLPRVSNAAITRGSNSDTLLLCSSLSPYHSSAAAAAGRTGPNQIHRSFSDSRHRYPRKYAIDVFRPPLQKCYSATTRSPSPCTSTVSCPEYGDIQDKVQRLESDRESLSLQVSVLAEQVGAQTERIKDLEMMLQDKKSKLDSTEEMLHEELVTRSTLETSKLDMIAEISKLKLKMASLERDKLEREQQLRYAQNEVAHLQSLIRARIEERGATVSSRASKDVSLYSSLIDKDDLNLLVQKLRIRTTEIEQLKGAVQHLMTNNALKDHTIQQLRSTVQSVDHQLSSKIRGTHGDQVFYRPTVPTVPPTYFPNDGTDFEQHLRQIIVGASDGDSTRPGRFTDPRASVTNLASAQGALCQNDSAIAYQLPPIPVYDDRLSYQSTVAIPSSASCSSASSRDYFGCDDVTKASSSLIVRQLAAELDQLALNYRQASDESLYHGGRLMRQASFTGPRKTRLDSDSGESLLGRVTQPLPAAKLSGLKSIRRLCKRGLRSCSVPNLHCAESEGSGVLPPTSQPYSSTAASFPKQSKHHSLKNLVSRLRRSRSTEIQPGSSGGSGGLKRGLWSRATSKPAFREWTGRKHSFNILPKPPYHLFCHWGPDELAEWLCEIDLPAYAEHCRQNIKSGRHLFSLSAAEIEKELGIKHQLHCKKLQRMLEAIEGGRSEAAEKMDCHQLLRWLDDIGLPQYREVFAEAHVDGLVLNALTVDDLLHLQITSALQHATFCRGIQVLRQIGFNMNRLCRKFDPHVLNKAPCPATVKLWTQQCVSEWLRFIDLSEFVPNLMCSGINGALMVLEPAFTAESLAAVIQIPEQKTLLRRHLSTHFSNLLGADSVAAKRQYLSIPTTVQLLPNVKVRSLKKGFSLTRKKAKHEIYAEPDSLVCPLNTGRNSIGALYAAELASCEDLLKSSLPPVLNGTSSPAAV